MCLRKALREDLHREDRRLAVRKCKLRVLGLFDAGSRGRGEDCAQVWQHADEDELLFLPQFPFLGVHEPPVQ